MNQLLECSQLTWIGQKKSLDIFVKHYQNHKEFRSGLIVQMMQAYVMKLDGVNNPIYG